MKRLIIDNRMRKIEKEYFEKLGYELIEIPSQSNIYDEISSHVDIYICKVENKIICSPQIIDLIPMDVKNVVEGHAFVQREYPNDIKYNVAFIGSMAIHSFKYTDYMIKKYLKEKNIKQIPVKQGYSRCNIVTTSNNSCITTDAGIHGQLIKYGIDSLLVEEENIRLLKKDSTVSSMKGFIGGATVVLENKFIVFGDFNKFKNADKIKEHLEKYNLKIVDFKGYEIIDYGSCMEV